MHIFRIRILLPALFGITVLFSIAQGIASMRSVAEMDRQASNIVLRMERSLIVADLGDRLNDIRRNYLAVMTSATPEARNALFQRILKAQEERVQAFDIYAAELKSPSIIEKFQRLNVMVANYEAMGAELKKIVITGDVDAARAQVARMTPVGNAAGALMKEMIEDNRQRGLADQQAAEAAGHFAFFMSLGGMLVAAAVALVAALFSFLRISRPINDITRAMNGLAAGDNDSSIPHSGRRDEIGEMAAAVAVFRDNAIERERLEREAEVNRSLSEQERTEQEARKAQEAEEIRFAVENLGAGLKKLSRGDMTCRLDAAFAERLDGLRGDFNESVATLQAALRSVGENAGAIDAGAGEILAAAGDLSHRTEQQASSVEETAAALEQVTTAVKDSAQRAAEAGEIVERARESAEMSGQIVTRTVLAVQDIEKSANEISNIISVIDEIAFQTNLLALNAGVEAARAGDAGKGFAVVAQEVRELAQRSANAAKEIKVLIHRSGEQVREGVALVGRTGEALAGIVDEVREINRHVASIVTSTREQSTGLSEISAAVNLMDQGTQKNAAMVEQTTAASGSLASQASALNMLLAQFKLRDAAENILVAGPASVPQPSPARAMGQKIAAAFGGGRQAAASAQEWSEF
ncbi:methyl-accepting chemotaxis protein [Agrobacterium leguminum]|uniref:Methyl-accepting chemotaxis sensory transducer n=1 Tax=Agrobacterium deltaense NCPPB 1641 TaxID=1183425 RepID=A0A1S7TIP7_9HYPH|nr:MULTISPECIES: methyl-accepting chemotaxis protein [Agrobacterium]WFS64785.1 methyl-accepting chemotaxis protein [Agrobacterium leguminum]CVI54478.1 Methyl-accepting chemotaxis sensory transducer [Agrobacterium deltaense NCPPB 1641]